MVILGETSGMGLATAKMLLDGGARVLVTGRSQAGLDSVRKELVDGASVVSSDARSLTDIDALARSGEDRVRHHRPAFRQRRVQNLVEDIQIDFAQWLRPAVLRFNLHPTLNAVQAILPTLKEKEWGRIVNLPSLVTLGMVNRTAYRASKAALGNFTRTWALEVAETGITVNSVAPGLIKTELFRRNTPAGGEAEQKFLTIIPMRRLQLHEIAAAVAFLLSEKASYITGQRCTSTAVAQSGRRQSDPSKMRWPRDFGQGDKLVPLE